MLYFLAFPLRHFARCRYFHAKNHVQVVTFLPSIPLFFPVLSLVSPLTPHPRILFLNNRILTLFILTSSPFITRSPLFTSNHSHYKHVRPPSCCSSHHVPGKDNKAHTHI